MSGASQNFQRFRKLPRWEREILIGAALLLPWWWARLKVFGHGDLHCSTHSVQPESDPSGEGASAYWRFPESRSQHHSPSLSELKRIGTLVNIAAHHVLPPGHCLARATYLRWLLQRRGIPTILRLGVQLNDGQLLAHAWVEWAGHPLNEEIEIRKTYAPFELNSSALDQLEQ